MGVLTILLKYRLVLQLSRTYNLTFTKDFPYIDNVLEIKFSRLFAFWVSGSSKTEIDRRSGSFHQNKAQKFQHNDWNKISTHQNKCQMHQVSHLQFFSLRWVPPTLCISSMFFY
eukprot:NODE_16_length_49026_cov_1.035992.p25 type:complete len:114 gc:universal NODE_16_length_49026_cov_1.035992:2080-2421(+)